MSFGEKVLFFFSFLGAFNAFILGVYFIFFTAKKHLSDYLLGALLIVLSIRIGKSVVYFFDSSLPRIYLQLGLTACLFIGPFLYFFIKSEARKIKRLPSLWLWQLAGWSLLIVVIGTIYPYEYFARLWWNYIIPLIYFQWGIYIIFSLFSLIPIVKRLFHKEELRVFEKWILTIFSGVLILFTCYVWAILNITRGSYIGAAVFFSSIIYLVIFTLLYRKKTNDLSNFSIQKYADKKLDDQEVKQIISKLTIVMKEQELFKNPNLKVTDLAKAINISGHQLSQILNESIDKNFTLFINEYRINEACKLLLSNTNLSVEAVADEVGFNAKSTFFAAFKRMKGSTPAVYQQLNTPDL